jgi:hypothetical protein
MTGIALNLGSVGGVRIDLSRTYSDLELDLQNAVVCTMTRKGSDSGDESRGTSLTKDVVSGYITSLNGARHAANFAALDTMQHLRRQSPPPGFSRLSLAPISVKGMALTLEMTVVDSEGNPVLFSTSFQ